MQGVLLWSLQFTDVMAADTLLWDLVCRPGNIGNYPRLKGGCVRVLCCAVLCCAVLCCFFHPPNRIGAIGHTHEVHIHCLITAVLLVSLMYPYPQ